MPTAYFLDRVTDTAEHFRGPDGTATRRLLDAWTLSDLHLGHERLEIGGPLGGVRPPAASELIVDQWREVVAVDDDVLVLGDVLVGSGPPLGATMPHLPGIKWLICGNHESRSKLDVLVSSGWHVLPPFEVLYRNWLVTFTHEPTPADDMLSDQISLHGHIHANPEPTVQHVNTSAEALDYRPTRLRLLLDLRMDELSRG